MGKPPKDIDATPMNVEIMLSYISINVWQFDQLFYYSKLGLMNDDDTSRRPQASIELWEEHYRR